MKRFTLEDLALPLINAIDENNYLLESHHRRVCVIAFYLGTSLQLTEEELAQLILAASIHDVGAVELKDRQTLYQVDVVNPYPHSLLGYKMLRSFTPFKEIADIIHYHHKNNKDDLNGNYPYLSFVLHFADRVDILLQQTAPLLGLKMPYMERREEILLQIEARTPDVFKPEILNAFKEMSSNVQFWNDLESESISDVFSKLENSLSVVLTLEDQMLFFLTFSKIVDYRTTDTVAHSLTVSNVAYYLSNLLELPIESGIQMMIAGFIHDIGRLSINPYLYEKSTPLTTEEFEELELKPHFTEKMLQSLGEMEWYSDVVFMATHIHQVDTLSKMESSVTLQTQLLQYAHILTALMENRPNRGCYSIQKALSIIHNVYANRISPELFNVIEKHSVELEVIIEESQANAFKEYYN